ncbi:MAG TPA: T9SS type A sorting domain-containing protein [Chitinophagaceae bacterium]|nr:T9SS type A sorting domain-containing protein [Chitinophagaceae bacterium]
MKYLWLLPALLLFNASYAQWTRVQQLPSSNIFCLFHNDAVFLAGGTNVVYISSNKGQTWTTSAPLPGFSPVTSIVSNLIVYKGEWYLSGIRKNQIFKTSDSGLHWQSVNAGMDTAASVTDFCTFNGNLFASTEGSAAQAIYTLDPVSKDHWIPFSNGLSGISSNLNAIIATSTSMVAGATANGLYDYLAPHSTDWEERFLLNQISPTEAVYDMTVSGDSLFLAGKTGKFYMSTDGGLNWRLIGGRLVSGATFLANAEQALISSRYIFDGVSNTTEFYYLRKDSLTEFPHRFSTVAGHFTWKIDIVGGALWDASDGGLFFMPLSNLPGITEFDEGNGNVLLPLRFLSVNTACTGSGVRIAWKTAEEQGSIRFVIERSNDSVHWNEIGSQPAAGGKADETSYTFTDSQPLQFAYYRIAEHSIDGKIHYSVLSRSNCMVQSAFNAWPNPAKDQVYLRIPSGTASMATIRLYNSNGALVKIKELKLQIGINLVDVDLHLLPGGIYSVNVSAEGAATKTMQIVKH